MTISHNSSQTWMVSAIIAGGFLAGTIDAISAFHTFGWRMTYGIASGVLGSKAIPPAGGGPAIWTLGLVLHYFIAFSAAAIYCVSSRHLSFLKRHWIFGSIACGIGVQLTMNLIVLPLSAVPFPIGPFTVASLRSGILFQIGLIGLPIALSLWFFARRENANVARHQAT